MERSWIELLDHGEVLGVDFIDFSINLALSSEFGYIHVLAAECSETFGGLLATDVSMSKIHGSVSRGNCVCLFRPKWSTYCPLVASLFVELVLAHVNTFREQFQFAAGI